MTSIRMCSFALAAALVAAPTLAEEDPVITRVVIWKAKPGMEAKLEAGIKVHNEFHKKQADTMTHSTYVVASGPNTGHYLRVAGGRNWKDFDAEALWEKADQADSAVNTEPYIESAMPAYYRFRPELSHAAPGDTPAPMYSLIFFKLRFAKVDDFELALKRSKEAGDKATWPRYWSAFSLVNGGDGPTWVISQAREKFADFNPPGGKSFAEMLEEQLGKVEAEARAEMLDRSVESVFTEMIAYRPDLSYVPAKK